MQDQRQRLAARLKPFGQEHVLDHWAQLGPEQQNGLATQLENLDLPLLKRLWEGHAGSEEHDWATLARRSTPPQAVRCTAASAQSEADTLRQGEQALAAGRVGVLLVAGGQGTRLGFDHPKGMFPLGPVSNQTLFQILLEKVIAASRRHGASIPVYLMTSHATHDETVEFLAAHDRFGLPAEDLFIFQQGRMPAVDADSGKLLLAEPGSLFLSPDGHGGTVAALASSGAMKDLQRRGIRQLFYHQVDNPLVPVCDAQLIGHHLQAGSELTSIAVAKDSPQDKLGNFVTLDGAQQIIEYSDFPSDVAEQREADGSLRFWAGSVAVHVFEVAFLERMLAEPDALPFHIAHKKVPYLDEQGRRVEPAAPNALKFERFIFDLLPHARNAMVVEAERDRVFAPLKNAPGADKDTADHVRQQIVALHRKWLEQAGVQVASQVAVEISPLWATDGEYVKRQQLPTDPITQPTFFHPDHQD